MCVCVCVCVCVCICVCVVVVVAAVVVSYFVSQATSPYSLFLDGRGITEKERKRPSRCHCAGERLEHKTSPYRYVSVAQSLL